MRKLIYILIVPAFIFSSCTNGMQGSPAAVQAGAAVGGMLGSIIGDRAGGYTGSQFGALLGTVAGAAIGNAATTPKDNRGEYGDDGYFEPNDGYSQSYSSPSSSSIVISNIRFIDTNKNHVIESNEQAKIVFDIRNDSNVAIYNVTPVVNVSGVKGIYVSPSAQISYMEPGNSIRYTAYVKAGKRIKTGQVDLNIYATDSNGSVSRYHQFAIPTQRTYR